MRLLVALPVCVVLAVAAACPSKPEGADVRAVLGTDGKPRWVVTFDGPEPDLAEYRALLKEKPDEADALAEKMRKKLEHDHAEFETQLQSLGGRIVERWWMSNAMTVELDASAMPSLKAQPGVESISEDTPLGE
jgi:hypothetical protein